MTGISRLPIWISALSSGSLGVQGQGSATTLQLWKWFYSCSWIYPCVLQRKMWFLSESETICWGPCSNYTKQKAAWKISTWFGSRRPGRFQLGSDLVRLRKKVQRKGRTATSAIPDKLIQFSMVYTCHSLIRCLWELFGNLLQSL